MQSLEEQAEQLMEDALAKSETIRKVLAGKKLDDELQGEIDLLKAQVRGIRQAICLLARTIDEETCARRESNPRSPL
jgi:hypothetical protein